MESNITSLDQELNPEIAERLEFNVAAAETAAAAVDEAAPDIDLCRLAADGNIAAFEVLYQRYHRRTYSLALRMTNSQTEAEDLTQEVFIQLFRKIGSFRGDSAFSTWLHRMTVNQVLMHFRRRSFKNEKTSEKGEMPEQAVVGSSDPMRMQVVDRIALKNAIAELPPGYKNVFILHYVEGYEHPEGCSASRSARQNRSFTRPASSCAAC